MVVPSALLLKLIYVTSYDCDETLSPIGNFLRTPLVSLVFNFIIGLSSYSKGNGAHLKAGIPIFCG